MISKQLRIATVGLLAFALGNVGAFCSGRELVKLEAGALSLGALEHGGREPLPLILPLLVKTSGSSGVFIETTPKGEQQIVLEKQAGSEEVAMQFEWANPATPPGRFIWTARVRSKAVSSGGALNVIFRSSDGKRVIPRLQVSNGGNLALVNNPDDVYRFEEKLPDDTFTTLRVSVDYLRRAVMLELNEKPIGDPIPIERGQPITRVTVSASDPSRARWTAFLSLTATEEP